MTDAQARIIVALRDSNVALTQAEIAKATGDTAEATRLDCYALGAAGHINYRGGFYTLAERRGRG